MKIICSKDILSQGIGFVQKAVSSKTTLPILEGILLEVDETFKMTGTDLEIGIECYVDAQIIKKGTVVINSRIFGDIVRRLPSEEVKLEVKDNLTVVIESGLSHFEVKGLPAQSFPSLPEINKDTAFLISQSALRDMIRQTLFAVSLDDNRPILKGSLLECSGNEVNIVSIDGFRVAHRKHFLDTESQSFHAVVPGKALSEIMKILGQDDENVSIYLSNNQILFEIGSCKVVSRLLEGEFMNYKSIIPREFETKVRVNTRELLSSIERASLITRDERRNPILLNLGDDKMMITSSTEIGEVREEIAVEILGNDLEIGFNPRYFIEALRVVEDEEIMVNFTSNMGPCTLEPIEGELFTHMILPVRVRN